MQTSQILFGALSALSLGLGTAAAQAQTQAQTTVEASFSHGRLTSGLPDAQATSLRAVRVLPGGDVLNLELVDERKFGEHGGTAAVAATKVLDESWQLGGTLVRGMGNEIWPEWRFDLELTKAWGERRNVLTRLARYHHRYEQQRLDQGWRLSVVAYLEAPLVLDAGVTWNTSEPGGIRSHMPYVAATLGRHGVQTVSLRASRGTEAYQALGAGAQLVNFRSESFGLRWQHWLSSTYGLTVQAERYRNPSYTRVTGSVGAFVQW